MRCVVRIPPNSASETGPLSIPLGLSDGDESVAFLHGDVIVVDDGRFVGLLIDRDIVVRAIADGSDPMATQAGDVMSTDIVTVAPDSTLDEAVELYGIAPCGGARRGRR